MTAVESPDDELVQLTSEPSPPDDSISLDTPVDLIEEDDDGFFDTSGDDLAEPVGALEARRRQ